MSIRGTGTSTGSAQAAPAQAPAAQDGLHLLRVLYHLRRGRAPAPAAATAAPAQDGLHCQAATRTPEASLHPPRQSCSTVRSRCAYARRAVSPRRGTHAPEHVSDTTQCNPQGSSPMTAQREGHAGGTSTGPPPCPPIPSKRARHPAPMPGPRQPRRSTHTHGPEAHGPDLEGPLGRLRRVLVCVHGFLYELLRGGLILLLLPRGPPGGGRRAEQLTPGRLIGGVRAGGRHPVRNDAPTRQGVKSSVEEVGVDESGLGCSPACWDCCVCGLGCYATLHRLPWRARAGEGVDE